MNKKFTMAECSCVGKLILKGKNNNQDLVKQMIFLIKEDSLEKNFLMIDRLVLTKEKGLYHQDYKLVKKFKDWRLYKQLIPIKLQSWVHINNLMIDVIEGRNKNFGTKIKL
jgi:hypothetical protein